MSLLRLPPRSEICWLHPSASGVARVLVYGHAAPPPVLPGRAPFPRGQCLCWVLSPGDPPTLISWACSCSFTKTWLIFLQAPSRRGLTCGLSLVLGLLLDLSQRRGSLASQVSRDRIGTSALFLVAMCSALHNPSGLHFLHLENRTDGTFSVVLRIEIGACEVPGT